MPFRLSLCKLSPEKTDSGRRLQSNMGCVIVTYQDLIQIGIFIVALANLIYQIFKEKKK